MTSDPTNIHDELSRLYDWRVAVWLGEEVARRWFGTWECYYRDSLSLLMSFPATRDMVAESLVAAASVTRDANVGPASQIDRELHFEVDSEADCVGPRYILLPWPLGKDEPLPQLAAIAPDRAAGPAGPLEKKNVMVRIENCARGRALSVTLVGLTREGRSARRGPRAQAGTPGAARDTYNLTFVGREKHPVKFTLSS